MIMIVATVITTTLFVLNTLTITLSIVITLSRLPLLSISFWYALSGQATFRGLENQPGVADAADNAPAARLLGRAESARLRVMLALRYF